MLDPIAAPAATATRAVLAALLRDALTAAAGSSFRGWVDQATADAAVSPIADYALGGRL